MLRTIEIENYKSIQKLKLELGRVTVLIGENGAGKSNILEAIALASAAANDKLDNEFLVSRGIEVTDPQFMRSAFDKETISQPIKISLKGSEDVEFKCVLHNDNKPYSKWELQSVHPAIEAAEVMERLNQKNAEGDRVSLFSLNKLFFQKIQPLQLRNFLIYSPEIQCLRALDPEKAIQPLGIKGEGLLKLLKILTFPENSDKLAEIKEKLRLIDCFIDFEIPINLSESQKPIQIKDRYVDSEIGYLDRNSYNEGFLLFLFYLALFISDDTPNFFAVDNIDASLNPRLCRRLLKELIKLAESSDKQVILTAHNPNTLDGLNLENDEHRLFVVYRNILGHTKASRIFPPKPLEGQEPVKMSEAFLRGYIGGLPSNF